MANLFQQAKETTKAKSVEKHEVVEIDKKFELKLKRLTEIDSKLAELESERAVIDGIIRPLAKEKMVDLYDKTLSFPGTIKVRAGNFGFQFITSDKYLKIDADIAAELKEKYGKEVIASETTFAFNPVLLAKYEEVLSDLISKSKKIQDEDKKSLITATTSLSVAKGTIKNLRNVTFSKFNLGQLIDDIKPIFSIKSIKQENN